MLLVTVVASSPALQGTQSEFTDDSGQYFMSNIPAGRYSLLFIYGDAKVKRENVDVGVGKTTVVNAKINTQATGEVITIKEKAPTIDAGSTKQGTTLQQDYIKNIPTGRTWQGVLGAAAGAQGDTYGTSFSGSTSVENAYVVDGLNTTGVSLGNLQGGPTQGTGVINNFIQEIEVITGGYNAEFGRSTGGVVNVVTKTGSNEFHGSVFANVQALSASVEPVIEVGTAMRYAFDPRQTVDFGFELGGPIVKDRLWFYVGFAPSLNRDNYNRIVSTSVDRRVRNFNYGNASCPNKNSDMTCDGDGNPATSSAPGCELLPRPAGASATVCSPPRPRTNACESDCSADLDSAGFTAFEEIERREDNDTVNSFNFTAKLNFAVAPEHQGQLGITGTPVTVSNFPNGFTGTETAIHRNETNLTTDTAFKWTSKFFDNKTQVDAIVGWHRFSRNTESVHSTLPNSPDKTPENTPAIYVGSSYGDFANLDAVSRNLDQNESDLVQEFCEDGTGRDAFRTIVNCPIARYWMNSPGRFIDNTEQRWSAKATITQRVKAAGHHQFKAGIDWENNLLDTTRFYTGGKRFTGEGDWAIERYVVPGEGTDICGINDHGTDDPADDTVDPCRYLDKLKIGGETMNLGAFLQDSWSILPNLTVNAGLRYEQQYLRYGDVVKGTIDPITGKPLPKNAMELTDLLAPRVGAIFDWTKEGRSKIYANWGRFYESIPMDINDRSFGGEVQYDEYWDYDQCGMAPTGPNAPKFPSLPENCPTATKTLQPGSGYDVIGAGSGYGAPFNVSLVLPNIGPQYLDEFVAGVEYELLEDLRLGVSYQNRRVGRVIEDVSVDGAATYFVANPGEFDPDAEAALLNQIRNEMDPVKQGQLIDRVMAFRNTKRFDKPQRVYNAVQLTGSKRFSRAFMVQGSYTYSKLEGNYPGLFSPDSGQLDPNITSQYDLFELLANRIGPLPFDRPHSFKIDGYYKFDLKEAGTVTAGARLRGQSGQPITPISGHLYYGSTESYLLPRGADGRTDFETGVDLHLAYGRKLGSTDLEIFLELFNVFNNQGETSIDTLYSRGAAGQADPIVGGTAEDLYYLKSYRSTTLGVVFGGGAYPTLTSIVPRSLNYANTDARQSPLAARIGATLSF